MTLLATNHLVCGLSFILGYLPLGIILGVFCDSIPWSSDNLRLAGPPFPRALRVCFLMKYSLFFAPFPLRRGVSIAGWCINRGHINTVLTNRMRDIICSFGALLRYGMARCGGRSCVIWASLGSWNGLVGNAIPSYLAMRLDEGSALW